jgi:hypothetical protein
MPLQTKRRDANHHRRSISPLRLSGGPARSLKERARDPRYACGIPDLLWDLDERRITNMDAGIDVRSSR